MSFRNLVVSSPIRVNSSLLLMIHIPTCTAHLVLRTEFVCLISKVGNSSANMDLEILSWSPSWMLIHLPRCPNLQASGLNSHVFSRKLDCNQTPYSGNRNSLAIQSTSCTLEKFHRNPITIGEKKPSRSLRRTKNRPLADGKLRRAVITR